jgi:hypothetical protein
MSDREREEQALEGAAREKSGAADEANDEDASSPFDHPAFLPVLLWGLAVWFGYDGWINQDPEMLEHVSFNRWGFAILVVLGLYFTIQSIRETRARERKGPDA